MKQTSVETVARELWDELCAHKMALLLGAGISRNSGLPLAPEITKCILDKLPLSEVDRERLIVAKLRLEVLLESIQHQLPVQRIIGLMSGALPNTNHRLFARLAAKGLVQLIVTTNFDELIEDSLAEQGLEPGRDFQVLANEAQFETIGAGSLSTYSIHIFKLHGTSSDEVSIRTTLRAIASREFSEALVQPLRQLFSVGKHDTVLVLGYSCSDAFDVNPILVDFAKGQWHHMDLASGPFTIRLASPTRAPLQTKRVILVEHSTGVSGATRRSFNHSGHMPFASYQGEMINCDTDALLAALRACVPMGESVMDELECNSVSQWRVQAEEAISGAHDIAKFVAAGKLVDRIGHVTASIWYFDSAVTLCEESTKDSKQLADCLRLAGEAYRKAGQYAIAISRLEQLRNVLHVIGNESELPSCETSLGELYRLVGRLANTTRSMHKREDAPATIIEAMYMAGAAFRDGQFNRAIDLYETARVECVRSGDKDNELNCWSSLGNCYAQLNEQEAVVYCTTMAVNLARGIGDVEAEATITMCMASGFAASGRYSEAVRLYGRALTLFNTIESEIGRVQCRLGMGGCFARQGHAETAISTLQEAVNGARNAKERTLLGQALFNLGSVLSLSGNECRALEYYVEAFANFSETSETLYLRMTADRLAVLYESIGEYAEAARYRALADGAQM